MRDHYDFSEGKRGAVVPTSKERITIRLDPDVIAWFKQQARGGGNYQSLINDALHEPGGKASTSSSQLPSNMSFSLDSF